MQPRSARDGIKDIFSRELVDGKPRGELWELLEVRTLSDARDELSDIAWGVGRFLAGLVQRPYLRVPGDRRHYDKVVARLSEHGCIRSGRFLIDGRCPNGATPPTKS